MLWSFWLANPTLPSPVPRLSMIGSLDTILLKAKTSGTEVRTLDTLRIFQIFPSLYTSESVVWLMWWRSLWGNWRKSLSNLNEKTNYGIFCNLFCATIQGSESVIADIAKPRNDCMSLSQQCRFKCNVLLLFAMFLHSNYFPKFERKQLGVFFFLEWVVWNPIPCVTYMYKYITTCARISPCVDKLDIAGNQNCHI